MADQESTPYLIIFFCRPLWPLLSFREKILTFLVCLGSRSNLYHVAIGDGKIVLDPKRSGNICYSFDEYVRLRPDLFCCFKINVPRGTSLMYYCDWPNHKVWRTFWRWATMGWLGLEDDCVSIALYIMMDCGLNTPLNITTPQHLYEWLERYGSERISL